MTLAKAVPDTGPGGSAEEDPPIVPRRHPWRWVLTAVVLVLVAMLVHGLVFNPRYEWATVARYLFAKDIMAGLLRTLALSFLAMAIGVALGVVLALMRQSGAFVLIAVANAYIWFFRGTPLLVQLIFWFNISALYPTISLGIPFGPAFVEGNANQLITPMVVAVIGLGLNSGAYTCEIVRGGLLAVPRGQLEAASALGMPGTVMFRRIVFPQAVRVMIPPLGNEAIGMLKYTALVSVIALPELLYSAQIIYTRTFETIPLLIVASIWYLVATTLLTLAQNRLERRYGRGVLPRRRIRFVAAR